MRILHLPVHASGVSYYRHHLPYLALRAAGHVVHSPNEALGNWASSAARESVHYKLDEEKYVKDVLDRGVDVIHSGWSNNLNHVELLVAAREKYKVPIIIDYDDDVLSVDEFNVSYKYYHEGAFSRRVARLGMRVADCISVSTRPLEVALKKECRFMSVLENYTHPPHWQDSPLDPQRHQDASVRVIFAGGPSHLGDVNQAREAIEWLVGHYDGKEGRPHVKLIFLCCMPDWAEKWIKNEKMATANRAFYVPGTNEDTRLWHHLIRWIAPDIWIAPLTHSKFNASKSLIKAYDAAMTDGCAFLCEDWPAYDDVPDDACLRVSHKSDKLGLKMGNEGIDLWQAALKVAVENADLRHSLSRRLREWTLDTRTIMAHISEWQDMYEEALARPIVTDLSDIVRPRIYGPDGQLASGDD